MAKQTFTTGQVLTAAQMSSLQQTAMGGGSPVTKTASYVLTAADAGTVIQMNSATGTTITVNTALFSAGDSVQIQNIGAGTCTITAGTATVNSAGSLGITQYDGGFLYFSSASSAIWFDYTQAGTAIPLTTKGDLFGYSTTNARIPVGANATVLTADSTEALGVKWATVAGGGMTLINTGGTTFANGTNTISSIPSTYQNLFIVIEDYLPFDNNAFVQMRFNSDGTASRHNQLEPNNVPISAAQFTKTNANVSSAQSNNSGSSSLIVIEIPNYANTTTWKMAKCRSLMNNGTTVSDFNYTELIAMYNQIGAISSLQFSTGTNNTFGSGAGLSGTIYVYGVK
jgi:hypothetical protein